MSAPGAVGDAGSGDGLPLRMLTRGFHRPTDGVMAVVLAHETRGCPLLPIATLLLLAFLRNLDRNATMVAQHPPLLSALPRRADART